MFRVVFHPSSGAHYTVYTVSGINETVTATCCFRPATFTTGSITCLINARYCWYCVMSSWWWVKYHPKQVEQLTDLNKLYSVASCWIIIAILYDARSIEHKMRVIMTVLFYHVRVLRFRVASECVIRLAHAFAHHVLWRNQMLSVICFGNITGEALHSNDDIIGND